ncbi:MAG TPA: CPBP family intramembrane metalloprotease [Deltaproteobacteria bacterium]|nr:CPBP family intramembrane metalloprotease [Deltaproteobacteria bacterium]
MDRRLALICAVCVLETGFRWASGHVAMDWLAYTLLARCVEMAVILGLAYRVCGAMAPSVPREIALGFAVSAAFGSLVVSADLASRLFVEGGVLQHLLVRQAYDQWLLYLLAACIVGPFVEELFFRGLLYAWMRERCAAWLCVGVTALLFASMHGRLSVVQLVGGILFGAVFEWRRSVWAGYVLHAAANLGLWIIPFVHPLM